MILGFVIILSMIGVSLALIMYANLLPFIGTLGDIKEYNVAYYGAQTALERSLLVLREREAGFDGAGGWSGSSFVGPASDSVSGFGAFSQPGNTLYRHIAGRSDSIPGTGMGNIELRLLSGSASNDYNLLGYAHPQHIPLRYDAVSSSGAYRSDIQAIRSLSGSGMGLQVYLRLNETIKNLFAMQSTNAGELAIDDDYDGDGTSDDIAVDRGWRGSYIETDILQSGTFTILPRSLVLYNSGSIGTVLPDDESVRESTINTIPPTTPSLHISNSQSQGAFNLLSSVYTPTASSHRIITDSPRLSGLSFIDMLAGGTSDIAITKQILSLSLFSPLLTPLQNLYPFIEYRVICEGCDSGVSANGPQIAQPYFLIDAESTVGDYTVTMQLRKGIDNDTAVSQFTVIF